ncbi:tumor necrosis factor receptor superfamily member 6 isoform X1 [Anolis carolinensis]|uniref:tumor necrosis factor receptor superfamily member 6 isoform X1 n=1 Tax=Anolis carolinensis TaxID=28377 RepID=UPI002F2B18E1
MTGKLLLYLLTLCPACSLISGPSLDNDSHRPYKKRFAVKRISKRDGIICQLNMQYQFNTTTGVICCSSCNPGSVAINIGCTKTYPITKCKNCIEGKEYMDKFNHKTKCLRCNDCDKEHGLEVETNCTAKQNVKCKCRPGFFCNSPPCQHCDPCDTCEEGTVLEKCTETQNTKCQRREHVPWYKWALPILFVILVAVPVIFIICKRMRNNRRTYRIPPGDKNNETEPMYPDIDLTPCIPDIAEEMKLEQVMKFVRKLGVSPVCIDAVKNNNNNDVTEQKIKLLECWYQETGRKGAFKTLITTLDKLDLRATADKIQQKINPEA